ncbi:craniofacial development protein 2-like [Penaeus indicus]|uniref:craniofacial development protein 2-like n=1 Tax=Penaeus indicus TaxID=29960 RepID=UPI00300C0341
MGDFNAKVGNERVDNIVGPHGLGSRNERGEMLVEWAQTNNMIIGNTWFKQPLRRLWTWLSPDDHTRNQINYILVNKRFRNSLLVSKTLPRADCYSDHVPVMGRFRAKMRTLKKPTLREQLDVSLLQIRRGVRQGCVLSPDLFSIYSEIIMRSLECLNGIKIGGNNINNLRYADDIVQLAETEEDLQSLLNTAIAESERKDLSINNTKTKTLVVIKKG